MPLKRSGKSDEAPYASILEDVAQWLRYCRQIGIPGLRVSPSVREEGPPPASKPGQSTLEGIRSDLQDCALCRLHEGRRNIVFGAGDPKARLMFIGEGPGRDEDIQGVPFVGRAGRLLTRIIESMGRSRKDVYIANIVKCRPPNNRSPQDDEIQVCMPFVIRQIEAIQPKVICALGAVAAQALLKTTVPITRLRGRFYDFRGTRLLPTYHPAFLLRNPSKKRETWEDVQKIMELLAKNP